MPYTLYLMPYTLFPKYVACGIRGSYLVLGIAFWAEIRRRIVDTLCLRPYTLYLMPYALCLMPYALCPPGSQSVFVDSRRQKVPGTVFT